VNRLQRLSPICETYRNTNDSNSFQKIADTYGSAQYDNGQTTDEYVKSGVFSHWFYVLVNGESGINDINNTYSVNGIGLDKAEKLIVEAVFNNYLDNTAFYPEVRTSMINAAKALFCDNSAEVKAVTDAWYAVGVGPAYSGSAIMDVAASSLVCSGGSVTLNNVPSGTAVTWQGSGSLLSPSSGSFTASGASQSIPLTAISPTSGGSASFTVTLNNLPGCSVPAKIEKNFWFGLPSANISAVYNSSNNWVTFNPASPSTGATYSWVIDGVTYPYGNAIHPLPACGGSPYITTYTFEATLTAVNSCGTSTRCQQFKFTCVPSKTFTSLGICGAVDPPPCDPSIVAYEVSPNPANSQINVVIVPPCESITADNSANGRISSPDEDESKSPEDVGTQSVVLYDLQGQKRYSEVFTNKKNFNIDVSSLSQGIYILRISTDKQIEQRRIVISK
jgi:bacillolysin